MPAEHGTCILRLADGAVRAAAVKRWLIAVPGTAEGPQNDRGYVVEFSHGGDRARLRCMANAGRVAREHHATASARQVLASAY